jgi:hypothetical protein
VLLCMGVGSCPERSSEETPHHRSVLHVGLLSARLRQHPIQNGLLGQTDR